MAELNQFAVSAALGSTLGPRVRLHHGPLGAAELAATIDLLVHRRKAFIEDLDPHDDQSKRYEKAVTRAYLQARQGFSSDRVLADPAINAAFIKACLDFDIEDTPFRLNMVLIGLRKHNKLKAKSKKSVVPDVWRVAVASEIAARAMYFQRNVSVDTTLAHPGLVKEFDRIARSITPGFSSLQYRWAALNMRKRDRM